MTAVETTTFESVDFCTLATVKAEIDATSVTTANDAAISRGITDVSAMMTRYLGFHTLIGVRTEVYELRHGKRILTLDARPIPASPGITSLKIAQHPDDLSSVTQIDSRDYVVRREAGAIKFSRRMYPTTAYVEVTYSGGLADDAAGMEAAYPELARACSSQVRYLIQRRDSLGGNVKSIAGNSTQFMSQYKLLHSVTSVLDAIRRQPI